uniref:Uncharacterized protein n=1 Tax=Cannabis sativa TaxID=3483 RepID=A0A803NVV0_CANSA
MLLVGRKKNAGYSSFWAKMTSLLRLILGRGSTFGLRRYVEALRAKMIHVDASRAKVMYIEAPMTKVMHVETPRAEVKMMHSNISGIRLRPRGSQPLVRDGGP